MPVMPSPIYEVIPIDYGDAPLAGPILVKNFSPDLSRHEQVAELMSDNFDIDKFVMQIIRHGKELDQATYEYERACKLPDEGLQVVFQSVRDLITKSK